MMQHLLLLHGAIGAADQLKPLAETLQGKYKVHLINFSGHGGKAFSPDPFSMRSFAEEVMNYLQEQEIEKVSIFGYSMGGYVAMYLARYHPHKIDKVITLATKFHWDETVAAREVKMLDPAVIELKVPAFAQQLKERHAPQDWKMLLEKTKELLLRSGRRNELQLTDYSTISIPCLLLIGDNDKMVTFEETEAVYKQLPQAELMVLPVTGHPIEQVDVGVLSFLVNKFLN